MKTWRIGGVVITRWPRLRASRLGLARCDRGAGLNTWWGYVACQVRPEDAT